MTQLHGISNLLAVKILAWVGDIDRFRSAAAFASYTADRQLNSCLHIMATIQN